MAYRRHNKQVDDTAKVIYIIPKLLFKLPIYSNRHTVNIMTLFIRYHTSLRTHGIVLDALNVGYWSFDIFSFRVMQT